MSAVSGHVEAEGSTGFTTADTEIEEVLREASRSPRLGLMLLSAKMERAARELASDYAVGVSRTNLSLSMLIRQLVEAEQLTREDAAALGLFNQVRNQRDYQEFRVRAGIMGRMEIPNVPTQRACYP